MCARVLLLGLEVWPDVSAAAGWGELHCAARLHRAALLHRALSVCAAPPRLLLAALRPAPHCDSALCT